MTAEPKLQPCPFCGHCEKYPPRLIQAAMAYTNDWNGYCDNCGATGPGDTDRNGAARCWNNRSYGDGG